MRRDPEAARPPSPDSGAPGASWRVIRFAAAASFVLGILLLVGAVNAYHRGAKTPEQVVLEWACVIATGGIVVGIVLLPFRATRRLGLTLALPSMSFFLGVLAPFVFGSTVGWLP